MKANKFYKIINSSGYVLSNKYEKACESVLGYGGVWTKDHRKAKRFKTISECQNEVNKMPCSNGTKFLVVSNNENWQKCFKKHFNTKKGK